MKTGQALLFLNQKRKPVWGIADLHAHPASHRAFGYQNEVETGLFWGNPGLHHLDKAEASLPACASDKHSGFTTDVVKHETRKAVINGAHQGTNWPHTSSGFPEYGNWPAARSPTHQQMHISWIHRAWRAGLRLMVASVTDNQVISMLWHRHHSAPPPDVDPFFDYDSARRQLEFIQEVGRANADWMEVVTTSAQAQHAIRNGKLAVVLAVELDQLSIEHLLSLVQSHNVRLVTPIHLVNNYYGGAAVYDELFNTANHFLTGQFFQVQEDERIQFRFNSQPQFLRYVSGDIFSGGDLIKWGAMEPTTWHSPIYNTPDDIHGHRNALGLNSREWLEQLMDAGLLIDIAHMSEACMEDTIQVAEERGYPLINTHTGLRENTGAPAESERHLTVGHAQRIANLGGVMGFGTGANNANTPIGAWQQGYIEMLEVAGNAPVALGTDMNGLDIQLDRSEIIIPDNFTIPGNEKETFSTLTLGQKTFDFSRDGLAHYGMLPEFLYAVSETDSTGQAISALYASAEVFLNTWRQVERRGR